MIMLLEILTLTRKHSKVQTTNTRMENFSVMYAAVAFPKYSAYPIMHTVNTDTKNVAFSAFTQGHISLYM